MGNNSVFDEIGIGASDIGLADDPDEVRADNNRDAAAASAARDAEKKGAEDAAFEEKEGERTSRAGSRSSTTLTGASGLDDEDLNVSRRTLLGS